MPGRMPALVTAHAAIARRRCPLESPALMTKAGCVHATRCRRCGTDVSAGLHLHDEQGVMCENCVLDTARHAPEWPAEEMPYVKLAEALAAALDAREHETGLHSKRVACHTMVLARHFSDDAQTLRQVYWGSLLHDIVKIGTPDAILLKQGTLTEEEWTVMRGHPETGRQILAGIPHLALASEIVFSHEEHFDGTGYPRGLAAEAIPLWARLFAVIDTLDAITSDRSYRTGLSFDNARTEIQRVSGSQLDPAAVAVFLQEEPTLRRMVELKCIEAPPRDEPVIAIKE